MTTQFYHSTIVGDNDHAEKTYSNTMVLKGSSQNEHVEHFIEYKEKIKANGSSFMQPSSKLQSENNGEIDKSIKYLDKPLQIRNIKSPEVKEENDLELYSSNMRDKFPELQEVHSRHHNLIH